jgi:inosine/xanthosine triphosphate pyrophosphatase family protein
MAKSNIPQIKEIDCTTGEEIIRDATADEISQMELDAANAAAKKAEAKAKAEAKQAIADRLGLTADELKLLLG